MPYFPMVKAIAPNAPIGAARITSATIRKTTALIPSSARNTGAAGSPTIANEMPNRTATNRTCNIDPSVSAETTVVGMISIRKVTMLTSWALSA